MKKRRAVERSVESLQRIYAFVVALAIGRAVESTFVSAGTLTFRPDSLPVFVAFLVTIVPFFHGMNRHLDRCYIDHQDTKVQKALLFDFAVFFIEAGLLFAFAASTQSGLYGFLILAVILLIDVVWGGISDRIHYSDSQTGTRFWAAVNIIAVGLLILVYLLPVDFWGAKPWILSAIAIVRSTFDYLISWELYFPPVAATST